MTRRALIRGTGLISAQGTCAPSTWKNLLAGRVLEKSRGVELPSDGSTRVSQLAIHAARQAIAEANWDATALSNIRTAIVIGSSKGPIENWLAQIQGRQPITPLIGVGELSFDIARGIGADRGPRQTFAAACASGLQALIYGDYLIQTNVCDRVLVVGAESSLHDIFIATFKRLGVLARPEIGCRPFDRRRDGFLMSEAAAAVCLESDDLKSKSQKGVYIHRTALASDPYHLTGMDESGQSIRYLLTQVDAASSDFIHAHGTATISADPIELAAIEAFAGSNRPVIYSHKSALGHTQGASGIISTVINVLAHEHGIIPPNTNTTDPIAHRHVRIDSNAVERTVEQSTILAAGFGGTLAAISLKNA